MPLPIQFDSEQYETVARRAKVLPSEACPLPGNSHAQVGTDGCKDFQRWARAHPNNTQAKACKLCHHNSGRGRA